MVIRFIGSESSYQNIKLALMGKVKVISSQTPDIKAEIYEVSSLKTLYSVPKSFKLPTFFYITAKEPTLHSYIRQYPISGIIFPPINPDSIVEKLKQISSAAPTRRAADYDSVRIKILAKAESIPPLPALAQQLIRLTRSDSATIKEVTDKIKMDQGISARVIKLVNTPFYGIRQEINSIDRATVLLGFNSVKNIAAAISMTQFYSKPFNMYKTTGNAMWLHSYKTACIAQLIAKETDIDGDSLYMAGLLHDVGKVLLAEFLVKETDSPDDEKDQLGMTHAEAGALILRKWSVTTDITEAVEEHHSITTKPMSKALYYANKIAYQQSAETAEEAINEMAITLDIKNQSAFKNKIVPLVMDNNAIF